MHLRFPPLAHAKIMPDGIGWVVEGSCAAASAVSEPVRAAPVTTFSTTSRALACGSRQARAEPAQSNRGLKTRSAGEECVRKGKRNYLVFSGERAWQLRAWGVG